MKLAKPHIDIGLFTNNLEPMLAFYQQTIGLPFDHMLPIGGGIRQHRHDLLGSVLKLNHARDPLPADGASGLRELVIARDGTGDRVLTDPDGNRVRLAPPGWQGLQRIGIVLGVRDPERHAAFLVRALGAVMLPGGDRPAARIGDSVLYLEQADGPLGNPAFPARGWCYITLQVFDVDAAHAGALVAGATEGAAPKTLGHTARISFICDPDGNWIELSQRASLTGPLQGS